MTSRLSLISLDSFRLKSSLRPELKDLVEHVTPQYAIHWKEIGILIGVPVGEIQIIEYGHPTMPNVCCNEMFMKWLECDVHASWDRVFAAIDSPAVSKPIIYKIPDSGGAKLTLKKLQKARVIAAACYRWYQLGIELLDDDQVTQLDIIKKNNDDVTERCTAMFSYWLQTHPNSTWYQLMAALREPGVELNELAASVEEKYAGAWECQMDEMDNNAVVHRTVSGHHSAPSNVSSVPSSSSSIRTMTFAHFSTVSEAFAFLTSKLRSQLTKADFCDIKRVCIEQTQSPSGAQLPHKLIEKVKSCQHINSLFDTLAESAYWSWIDIRLLNVMAAASGLFESIELLANYKRSVFSRKLIDFLPNAPSKKVKEEYYSKIIAKINKDAKDITVAELLEFQTLLEEVILAIKKGVCTVEHLDSGCIEVHWYIPTHYVNSAYQSAFTRCHIFNEIHLLWLQIACFPIIHDPLTTPVDMPTPPPPPDRAATVKDFIDHYYDYLSVNMDAEVVVPVMVSHQLFSEDIAMAAQSSYHKSCLILQQVRLMDEKALGSFCQVLTASHSLNIGEALINAFEATPVTNSAIITDPAQQLDTAAIQKINGKYFHTGGATFVPSSIATHFFDLMAQLTEVLQSLNPKIIADYCSLLRASEQANITLFKASFLNAIIKETKNTTALIHKFAPLINWLDHSILNAVVEACNVPEAVALLTQFDARIDASQPVTFYPIPSPSHHMVPYDTSTHTVLAVQLNLKLHHCTLQNVIDTRSLIQEKCEITPHCLQLLAVAKTNHVIIYWTIPKHVATLIISNVQKHQSYLYQKSVQQIAVYPGTILATGSNVLTVGPFSFFAKKISKEINKMQIELVETRKEHNTKIKQLNEVVVQMNEKITTTLSQAHSSEPDKVSSVALSSPTKWSLVSFDTLTTLKTVQSQQDQLIVQLIASKELEKSLKEKIVKEKQRYSNLLEQYKDLKNIFTINHAPGLLSGTLQQEEGELLEKQDKLNSPQLQVLDEETQTELTKLQSTMENVNMALGKVEVIMRYWNEKTTNQPRSLMKIQGESSDYDILSLQSKKAKNSLLIQLKKVVSNLSDVEEWSSFVQLIQTELSDSKQKIDQLENELTQANIFKLQEEITRKEEENKMVSSELAELTTQLMMKEKEVTKLKEDNKLLVKQFRERKDKKRRETIPQDQLVQEELLGSGRYGEVWKIHYGDKTYAGKIIHKNLLPGYPDTSVNQISQFVADIENIYATIFGSHEHPNIEQYYTIMQLTPDSPLILLSELQPNNLSSFTAGMKGKLPIHVQLDLCLGMAKGVQYLHANRVIHNNLHASNVLISQDGQAKIADYICPQVSELNEKTTPQHQAFMSPELIKNHAICSKPSDIYSLGVLFLQVATQNHPTRSEDAVLSEVQRHRHQLDEITTNPLLPVILQCLNILPARPSIHQLCNRINTAKQSPQNVMSGSLHHTKESPEFGLSLESKRYEIKWIKCSDLPVSMRWACGTVINDILYIGGGYCPDRNDDYYVFTYNPKENMWTKLSTALPQRYGIIVNINDVLTVIGGRDYITGRPTNKVLALEEHKLTTLYGDMKCARERPAVVSYQQFTIVAGGRDNSSISQDSIEHYNINTNQWTKTKTCLPQPMWNISATTCNDSIIIAGYHGADDKRYSTTYISTIDSIVQSHDDSNKWSELRHTPYWNTTTVSPSTPPVIVGGDDIHHKPQDSIMLYDDSSNIWRTVGSLPIRCAQTTVVMVRNFIIIAGGCTNTRNVETANATSLTSVVIGQLDRV